MKIYLNGPRSMRQQLLSHRETLVAMGCTVTSTWLDETEEPTTTAQYTDHIQNCVRDLHEAELTATFTGGEGDEAETYLALGISIGLRHEIAFVGPKTHALHNVGDLKTDATFEEFVEKVKESITQKLKIKEIKQRVVDALKKALPEAAVMGEIGDQFAEICPCEDCRKARAEKAAAEATPKPEAAPSN